MSPDVTYLGWRGRRRERIKLLQILPSRDLNIVIGLKFGLALKFSLMQSYKKWDCVNNIA